MLVLDVSASMSGRKIDELNAGLQFFFEELRNEDLCRKRVDLAIVTFGKDVTLECDFATIEEQRIPFLKPVGTTSMGKAIILAADIIEKRKLEYRELGMDYYRPWIFLITDGEPTDMKEGDSLWEEVLSRIHNGEKEHKFLFWALGVDSANMIVLRSLSPPNRSPLLLKEARFTDMFMWLSKSLTKISESSIGDQVILENPISPDGWGSIPSG